jgi:hypothetical protein
VACQFLGIGGCTVGAWLETAPSARAGRRRKEPDESPETVHRVALHVGAMIECQKWMQHSLQLERQAN